MNLTRRLGLCLLLMVASSVYGQSSEDLTLTAATPK